MNIRITVQLFLKKRLFLELSIILINFPQLSGQWPDMEVSFNSLILFQFPFQSHHIFSRTNQSGTQWVLFYQTGNYLAGWQPQKIISKAQEIVLLAWFFTTQNAIFFFLKFSNEVVTKSIFLPCRKCCSCIWQLRKTSCSLIAQSSQQIIND